MYPKYEHIKWAEMFLIFERNDSNHYREIFDDDRSLAQSRRFKVAWNMRSACLCEQWGVFEYTTNFIGSQFIITHWLVTRVRKSCFCVVTRTYYLRLYSNCHGSIVKKSITQTNKSRFPITLHWAKTKWAKSLLIVASRTSQMTIIIRSV